jgi:hypothetical protein
MPKFKFKTGLILWISLALVATLALYPFETTVVPQWKVRVTTESGNPVRGLSIREVWSHYSLESHDHEEDVPTDADGYATFSRRTIAASLLMRTVRTVISKLNLHGSSGPAAYLLVIGDYKAAADEPYYVPGRPLATEIVVRSSGSPPGR